jgi:hypothetical protein
MLSVVNGFASLALGIVLPSCLILRQLIIDLIENAIQLTPLTK